MKYVSQLFGPGGDAYRIEWTETCIELTYILASFESTNLSQEIFHMVLNCLELHSRLK